MCLTQLQLLPCAVNRGYIAERGFGAKIMHIRTAGLRSKPSTCPIFHHLLFAGHGGAELAISSVLSKGLPYISRRRSSLQPIYSAHSQPRIPNTHYLYTNLLVSSEVNIAVGSLQVTKNGKITHSFFGKEICLINIKNLYLDPTCCLPCRFFTVCF